jgi:hypothetical protein
VSLYATMCLHGCGAILCRLPAISSSSTAPGLGYPILPAPAFSLEFDLAQLGALPGPCAVGESIFVESEEVLPYIAKILGISAASGGNHKLTVSWYYRPEDTAIPGGRKVGPGPEALCSRFPLG